MLAAGDIAMPSRPPSPAELLFTYTLVPLACSSPSHTLSASEYSNCVHNLSLLYFAAKFNSPTRQAMFGFFAIEAISWLRENCSRLAHDVFPRDPMPTANFCAYQAIMGEHVGLFGADGDSPFRSFPLVAGLAHFYNFEENGFRLEDIFKASALLANSSFIFAPTPNEPPTQ